MSLLVYVGCTQQEIFFKGQKLKLGPAIMKDRCYGTYTDELRLDVRP